MPRKRAAHRRRTIRRWSDLSSQNRIALLFRWAPDAPHGADFQSWDDYLETWSAVRDEVLATRDPRRPLPYAERIAKARTA